MKSSQVSRANGTTQTRQSSVMKEGASLHGSNCSSCDITSMGMEVVTALCHGSFGVMRQVEEDFTSL